MGLRAWGRGAVGRHDLGVPGSVKRWVQLSSEAATPAGAHHMPTCASRANGREGIRVATFEGELLVQWEQQMHHDGREPQVQGGPSVPGLC